MKTKKQYPHVWLYILAGMVIALLIGCETPPAKPVNVSEDTWARFEAKLEYIRQQ